jgi:Amiloride-sensitive sodium channel
MQNVWYPTQMLQEPSPWHISTENDVVFMHFFDYYGNHSNNFEARAGYHLIIHHNEELPSATATHVFFWNQMVVIFIILDQVLLDENLKHERPEQRNCFFDHERKLKLFRIYTKENCEHECQSFAFARNCGCVPFYLISEIRIKVGTVSETKISLSRIQDGQSLYSPREKLHRGSC